MRITTYCFLRVLPDRSLLRLMVIMRYPIPDHGLFEYFLFITLALTNILAYGRTKTAQNLTCSAQSRYKRERSKDLHVRVYLVRALADTANPYLKA